MGPLWTVLFLLFAAGAGAQLLRWCGLRLERPAERFCFGSAVGLGAAAYAVLGIGLAGQLRPPVIAALGLGIGLVGAAQTLRLVREGSAAMAAWATRRRRGAEWGSVALVVGCMSIAALTLICALAPPDGGDWDGLSYHLAAPKIYLKNHRIAFIDYDSHTNFPFTVEMLFTLGLAWGKPGAAKLFHWAMGWLTALAVGVWVQRHLRAAEPAPGRAPEWAGPLAAALWLSIPVVIWEAGTAYIDLGTAFFQFTAIAALTRALAPEGTGERPLDLRWAALAGVLSGWALGTKATAMMQFGLLGLLLLILALRSRERQAWFAMLLFGALGILVGSPWYVKSYLWTNNPVYPFFFSLFPRSVNWTLEFEKAYREEQRSFGRGYGPLEMLRAPWDLAFNARHYFIAVVDQRRLIFDKWGSMGPMAIAYGPMLLFARGLDPKVWLLVAYAVASGLPWWFLSQQSRYLMPVFAPLLRRAAFGVAGVSVLVGLYYAGQMASFRWDVVSGQVSERAYLTDAARDLYPAAEFVNRLPPESRIALYQETRGLYFDRDYMWANPFQHNLIPYDRFQNGNELVDFLKQHQRITHILVNLSFAKPADMEDQHWWRLLVDAANRGRLVPVFESRPGQLRGILIFEVV